MGRSTKGRQDKYSAQFDLGTKDFKMYFDTITERVNTAIESALNELMETAYDLSQTYVPDSSGSNRQYSKPPNMGALKASGAWEKAKREGKVYITKLTYGDADVDYAFFVHENMPSKVPNKQYSTDGTGAYYLSRAINEVFTKENVIAAINKHLK